MNRLWGDRLEDEVYVTLRNRAIEPDFSASEEVIKADTDVIYHSNSSGGQENG